MTDAFTAVEIAFYPEYRNDWLRFGTPDVVHRLDRRRSLAIFKADQTFGYVRWRAGNFGTVSCSFTVARTGSTNGLARAAGVHPGAEILLAVDGAARVRRALAMIDQLEIAGFDPADLSPSHHRHLHNRLATGKVPRPYSAAQHAAWRTAQRAQS